MLYLSSHFLIKTTLISFLAYYTECSLTKLFLYSRSLHYYCLYPFYIVLINIRCSRVAVCRPVVLSIKRIYHTLLLIIGIIIINVIIIMTIIILIVVVLVTINTNFITCCLRKPLY